MVVKAYLIITSVNWQVHFPDTKNTGGDRHGLKLYFCSSDGSHKPSNVEARGRRSPRTSQKVRRTKTKTTAPVKSQPRSSCTLTQVKRRNPGALVESPPASRYGTTPWSSLVKNLERHWRNKWYLTRRYGIQVASQVPIFFGFTTWCKP